jgi:hypothetical protein
VKIGHCGHAAPDLKARTFPIEREGEDLWVVVEAKAERSEEDPNAGP